jgi:hypothetical protein
VLSQESRRQAEKKIRQMQVDDIFSKYSFWKGYMELMHQRKEEKAIFFGRLHFFSLKGIC